MTLDDRFWDKVSPEPNSGCWLWTANCNPDGYGMFWNPARKRMVLAHRVAFEAHKHAIPDGRVLDHLCRVRCCVNPEHLECVTQQINAQRGNTGKHLSDRTHCPKGHPYTSENTRYSKAGTRQCRECGRQKCREYYWKKGKGLRRAKTQAQRIF